MKAKIVAVVLAVSACSSGALVVGSDHDVLPDVGADAGAKVATMPVGADSASPGSEDAQASCAPWPDRYASSPYPTNCDGAGVAQDFLDLCTAEATCARLALSGARCKVCPEWLDAKGMPVRWDALIVCVSQELPACGAVRVVDPGTDVRCIPSSNYGTYEEMKIICERSKDCGICPYGDLPGMYTDRQNASVCPCAPHDG